MNTILYYSSYCKSSSKVLQILSKFEFSKDLHFICIDKRINNNGQTYAILQNGQNILIPKNIVAVPSLLIINQDCKVISGVENIMNYLQPTINRNIQQSTKNNNVPMCSNADDHYTSFEGFESCIMSDHFSFYDQHHSTNVFQPNVTNNERNSIDENKIKMDDASSLIDRYKKERDRDDQLYKPQQSNI